MAEPRDKDDIPDETVQMDSFDAFLVRLRSAGKEGVRGGRLGAFDLFRGGGRGGRAGDLFGVGGTTGALSLAHCSGWVGYSLSGRVVGLTGAVL
jgi:hypothetical protein